MENSLNKFRPILFSTPMVQAILEGIKTQTRRVVKPTPIENENYHFEKLEKLGSNMFGMIPNKGIEIDNRTIFPFNGIWKCPYEVGDVLWVRETFMDAPNYPLLPEKYRYKASVSEQYLIEWKGCWKPSIFMPKEACRIFLRLKSIKVERLKSITREDARSEGIERDPVSGTKFKNYIDDSTTYNEKTSFFSLWEMINGKRSLEANPYVFVYEFESIEKPLDFIV